MLTAAMEVYGRLPVDLKDDPERLVAWLQEEARTTMWHEIFLIHGPMQQPKGVLYASVYPEYRANGLAGPICVLNAIVARDGYLLDGALQIERSLWARLGKELRGILGPKWKACHYFTEELLEEFDPTEIGEKDRRKEFAVFLDEQRGLFRYPQEYWIPDFEKYNDDEESFARVCYLGPGGDPPPWNAVINFMYGFHYFWEFTFGKENTEFVELVARTKYTEDILSRTSVQP